MAARRLHDGELTLWFDTMRGVRRLRPLAAEAAVSTPPGQYASGQSASGQAASSQPVAKPLAATPDRASPAVPTPRRPEPALVIGQRQGGLDDTSWRMLGSGKLRPQRRLDLHGRHAEAAFGLLHGFLLRAHADRLRCVEIITGAGSGPEGGILRRELPHWLARADLRPLVLAAVHPHARNVGSVRLLMRRRSA